MMEIHPYNTQAHWLCFDTRPYIPRYLLDRHNEVLHKFVVFRSAPLAYEGTFGLFLFAHTKDIDPTRKRYIREMTNAKWRGFSSKALLIPDSYAASAFMLRIMSHLVERRVTEAMTQ